MSNFENVIACLESVLDMGIAILTGAQCTRNVCLYLINPVTGDLIWDR